MDELKKFINIRNTLDVLYTILIYNKSVSSILNDIEEQRIKAKNISNPVKKHKIMERLFLFENYLNNNYNPDRNTNNEFINSIFLIDETVYRYDLTTEMLNIAKEYNMRNYFTKIDTFFHIEYLIDFFTNFYFIYHLKVNKNEATLTKMNKNKEKEIYNSKSITESGFNDLCNRIRSEYNYKENIFVSGNSPALFGKISNININKNIILKNENLSRNDVWDLYENELMKLNIVELDKRIIELNNPKYVDLYVFGKLKVEIKEAMECYSLKELFIEEKKLEKLKEFVGPEFFNFKIYIIRALEVGDSACNFINSYNGIMGIKYY
jgi:hypothetical protein